MVHVEHRFVKQQVRRRVRRDGTVWARVYWYYRRPDAPDDGRRLPDDPASPEFAAALRLLNARAAEGRPPEQVAGSFAHLVRAYRASPEFTTLAPKSRRDYGRILGHLLQLWASIPVAGIDREVVYALRDRMADRPHMANYTVRVLRLVLGWAVERGLLTVNPAANPKQLRVASRRQVWSPEAEERFLAVASPAMVLAYALHSYTAQRQSDLLAMTWAQYRGGSIRLRQGKTGAWVEVPVHRELRRVLDTVPRVSTHILTDARGRPWKADAFRHRWRATTLAAGLDGLQNRDLRRTAMVRMAEAGANDIQIAAVSGHTIEETKRILETYIPRNAAMARAAVERLEAAGPRPKPKHQG